jgi:hypothetical protein
MLPQGHRISSLVGLHDRQAARYTLDHVEDWLVQGPWISGTTMGRLDTGLTYCQLGFTDKCHYTLIKLQGFSCICTSMHVLSLIYTLLAYSAILRARTQRARLI